MKLYEISDEIAALLSDVDEIPAELETYLDDLQCEFEHKVENCCRVVRNLEAEAEAFKAEADRLAARAHMTRNAVARLKEYVKFSLEKLGVAKMEAGLFKVRVQANSQPSVFFDGDPKTLPPEYQRVKVEMSAAPIVEAWKAGHNLPPGVEVVKGSHLRIA